MSGSAMSGKVVVITGATGNLGRAAAKLLAGAGAQVIAVYRTPERLKDLLDFVGPETRAVEGIQADVTRAADVQALVEEVIRRHGRIDVLLNLAGAYRGGAEIAGAMESDWDFLMATNLKSAFLCSKAVLPAMMKADFGRIISVAARPAVERRGRSKSGPYAVSKAGVVVLTETLAEETKKFNITANCLLPGTLDTPENRKSFPTADFAKWVKPEEIAEVILRLISDEFAVTSGASVPVYGKS